MKISARPPIDLPLLERQNDSKMKVVLALLAVSAAISAHLTLGVPLDIELEERIYPRFMEIAGDDGQLHLVDLEAEPDVEMVNEITRNPANNRYFLYTRSNPTVSQQLIIDDVSSIWSSNFNPHLETVVVSHGWLGSESAGINELITAAYLEKREINVIVIDWRRLAISDYVSAAYGIPAVGRALGQFLAFLNAFTGAPFENMHLVGFSLGAHLVGNAGRELGGKIARITGLDPAGPLWQYSSNRIGPNDAVYVEAVHTDGSLLGYGIGKAVAQVDFFPNGGNSQPGCITNICDHNRAWELFAASVTWNHLIGTACSNNLQITLNTCRGGNLPMGNDDIRKTGSGKYRVNTGSRYPF